MNERILELAAEALKALGHPLRLKIIKFLQAGERCVCEIIPAVGAEQSVVSKHLAVLKQTGLVDARKEGPRVIYWVRDPGVFAVCALARELVSRRLAELVVLAAGFQTAQKG
ncbi:MAG: metalloregulator ArsR/SmtB family transcription factor [Bacillota bacterium]